MFEHRAKRSRKVFWFFFSKKNFLTSLTFLFFKVRMPPDLLQSFQFDTAALGPRDGFAAWSSLIEGFDATAADLEHFSAAAQAWMLGPLVVTRTKVSGVRLVRSPERIRQDTVDHYVLVLQLEGDWEAETGERQIRSAPGITCIFDKALPFVAQSRRSVDIVIVLVPRAVMEPAAAMMALHGHALTNEAGRLLSDYLHVLVHRLESLTEIEAPYVAKATLEIMRSCVQAAGAKPGDAKPVDVVRRAARLIDRNLAEPLTPEKLQSALNLSRSSLYRAFEPLGGVAFFIRDRRLARIHAMVSSGERASVSQLAATFGFTSAAQLTRAFTAHFGYSVSDLRARTRLAAGVELYRGWTKAIS